MPGTSLRRGLGEAGDDLHREGHEAWDRNTESVRR